jgi:tetratricopeptide (TPR) repeat protein
MAARNGDDRLDLARHFLAIGNPKRALAELEQSGSAAVEEDEFWLIRAEALFELERWDEGAEAARRGLAQNPDDVILLDVLAICDLELGRAHEADETIRAAPELAPDHPTLLAHRALILARSKRSSEAERVLAEALRVNPRSLDVLIARAQVAALDGDRQRAAEYADDLLEAEPESEFGHLIRGAADVESVRFTRAVRHLEEAARLNPEPEIREALREARVGAHPLLAIVRPVWRLGRMRSWLIYLTIAGALAVARLHTLRSVIVGIWITIVVLSWVAPPILRRWYGRKSRGF